MEEALIMLDENIEYFETALAVLKRRSCAQSEMDSVKKKLDLLRSKRRYLVEARSSGMLAG